MHKDCVGPLGIYYAFLFSVFMRFLSLKEFVIVCVSVSDAFSWAISFFLFECFILFLCVPLCCILFYIVLLNLPSSFSPSPLPPLSPSFLMRQRGYESR